MKDKKRRRLYIHEPEAPSFVATTSTANRIRSVLIDAPVTTPAVEVDTSTPPTATFDYALGELNDTADVMENNQQTDSSGLVVKAKAKRYINSVRLLALTSMTDEPPPSRMCRYLRGKKDIDSNT